LDRTELISFLVHEAGVCGCAPNDSVVPFLLDLLEVADMRMCGLYAESTALLNDMLPDDECWVRSIPLYWIASIGLTEHGDRGLDDYTLTPLGEDVLEALREYGTDDSLWDRETPPMVQDSGGPDRSLN
jgi:hypothetical protein